PPRGNRPLRSPARGLRRDVAGCVNDIPLRLLFRHIDKAGTSLGTGIERRYPVKHIRSGFAGNGAPEHADHARLGATGFAGNRWGIGVVELFYTAPVGSVNNSGHSPVGRLVSPFAAPPRGVKKWQEAYWRRFGGSMGGADSAGPARSREFSHAPRA